MDIGQNKQAAINFLQMVVAGQIDEAYEQYVSMSGKHHNAYYPAGFSALQQGMKDNHAQFPSKKFEVKRVLSDGNLIAVHSHVVLKEQETEIAVVHILRFEDGKIIEMWDVGQMIPHSFPNSDGMF